MFLVTLCALASAQADTITLGSTNAAPGAVISLPFGFTNTNQIVGMQFDLNFPATMVQAGAAASSAQAFTTESRELASGQRRVVLFSPTNQVLPGNAVLSVPLTLLPGSPAGGPTVSLRNIILTNRKGQTFTPVLNYPALDAWRQKFFTEAGLNDARMIGDDKDPDGDGVPNLLEFIQGTHPLQKQAGAIPVITPTTPEAPASFSLVFKVQKGTNAAALKVETSTDLESWGDEDLLLTATGVSDEDTMELRASVPMAGAARRFFRLVGNRSPGTISFFDARGQQQSVAVDFDALTAWKRTHFPDTPANDPAKANDADPDGDSISNLMEFYAGTDPLNRASVAIPRAEVTIAANGARQVSFLFRTSTGALPGVLQVENSTNLQNWNTEAVQWVPNGNGDPDGMEWRVQFPAGAGTMFFRLKGGQ